MVAEWSEQVVEDLMMDALIHESLIAFDEKVTFFLASTRPLTAFSMWDCEIDILKPHVQIIQHMHKAVTCRVEAKKLLSRQRHSDYCHTLRQVLWRTWATLDPTFGLVLGILTSWTSWVTRHSNSSERLHRSHIMQYQCGFCKLTNVRTLQLLHCAVTPVAVAAVYTKRTLTATLTCSSHRW